MSALDELTKKENWYVDRTFRDGSLLLEYVPDLSWGDIEQAAEELASLHAQLAEVANRSKADSPINLWEEVTGECVMGCNGDTENGHENWCPGIQVEAKFASLQAIKEAARKVLKQHSDNTTSLYELAAILENEK